MPFLLGLVPSFIPERFRKLAAIVGVALLAIALFFGAKALYDRSVIEEHDAKRETKILKADRKADEKSAVERRVDDERRVTETQEVQAAIDEARSEGRDARAAYYECVAKQQAARRERKPVPEC